MSNELTRYQQFRIEMIKKEIKWKEIAELLGISVNGSLMAIQRETIKPEYYAKLLQLGFSESVLPRQITK